MSYINVNPAEMLNSADEIDRYVMMLDKHMTTIDIAVTSLGSEWKGNDYNQLKNEWNEINSNGSSTEKLKNALKNYSESIREASKLYKEAQARAVNRANSLCKK